MGTFKQVCHFYFILNSLWAKQKNFRGRNKQKNEQKRWRKSSSRKRKVVSQLLPRPLLSLSSNAQLPTTPIFWSSKERPSKEVKNFFFFFFCLPAPLYLSSTIFFPLLGFSQSALLLTRNLLF